VPRGAGAKILERIRPLDRGQRLEIETTVTDPEMLSKPWTTRKFYDLRQGGMLEDFVCVDRVKANPKWASTDGGVVH
jgi:hypothetical protein